MRRSRWLILSRAWILAGTFALVPALAGAEENAASETKKTIPNFTLKDLDEKPVALYDLLEKGPVLVSFWATWCKPCLQEMPHLSTLADSYTKLGLTTLAISIDEPRNKARVRSHVQSKAFHFRTLLDPNQDAYRKLQGQSVPYVILLDAKGHVAYAKVGYRPGDERILEQAIDSLLGIEAKPGDEPAPSSGTHE